MHDSARRFCEATARRLRQPRTVAEIGARNVNGGIRYLFPRAAWIGVDAIPGAGVDIVADGATWAPGRRFDVVICTETLEHAQDAAALTRNLADLCRPSGAIVITAATPEREPHSAIDGGPLREGEHYRGVTPAELTDWLAGCAAVLLDARTRGDVYCLAFK